MPPPIPAAHRTDLVVQNMDGELVLYDPHTANASVLNHTAAVIWQFADGTNDVNAIAQRATQQLGAPVDANLVWFTLKQLSNKHLLQSAITPPAAVRSLSRRDFLRAGAVGAAVVLPVIVTMTAPASSHAASCVASGQPCQFPGQCCSENCRFNTCD